MKSNAKLRLVTNEKPGPSLSYEYEQRKRILGRDWASVHVSADKRSPFATVMGRLR